MLTDIEASLLPQWILWLLIIMMDIENSFWSKIALLMVCVTTLGGSQKLILNILYSGQIVFWFVAILSGYCPVISLLAFFVNFISWIYITCLHERK